MILAKLLDGLINHPLENRDVEIKGITLDSRKVKKGFLFIAVAGAVEHGLVYAKQAINNGAIAIIYEPKGSECFKDDLLDCYTLEVKGLGVKLGKIADRFYQSPSKKLEVIGVTGTNGKTTCSQFLLQLMPESGVIGTLGWGEKEALTQTLNTTPDALDMHHILAEFVKLKKKVVVMEVSSHGLEQGRVNAVNFKGAIFTNLTRDHLDYHGSMAAYLEAKLMLFKRSELQFVVVNSDDENSRFFLEAANSHVKKWAFSAKGNTIDSAENIIVEEINNSLKGINFVVCWGMKKALIQTKIIGACNLENILAVIAVLLAQGYSLDQAASKVEELNPVSGRMECFGGEEKPFVIVDYAHTPDALEKVLLGLRAYCEKTLWVVFGCGGNRDQGKRAEMGSVAERLADRVVITDDNPRLEKPEQIINDILQGCARSKCEVISDRKKAIQSVINKAGKRDCIVIAGKGHESYQDVHGVKHDFSDQDVVQKALLERV